MSNKILLNGQTNGQINGFSEDMPNQIQPNQQPHGFESIEGDALREIDSSDLSFLTNQTFFDDIMQTFDAQELEDLGLFSNMNINQPPIIVESDESPWIGQWSKFNTLVTNTSDAVRMQMDHYYRLFENFLDFRQDFQDTIERISWHLAESQNSNFAKQIILTLQQKVDVALSNNTTPMAISVLAKLGKWQRELRGRYFNNPMELTETIFKMLNKESSILELANRETMLQPNNNHGCPIGEPPFQAIKQILEAISTMESSGNEMVVLYSGMYERHQDLMRYTHGNIRAFDGYNPQSMTNADDKRKIESLHKIRDTIIQDKNTLIYEYHQKRLSSQLQLIVEKIKNEIVVWQRYQGFANNGNNFSEACDIDHLEDCCRRVANLLNMCLDQIEKLGRLDLDSATNEQHHTNALAGLRCDYEISIKDLIENALVVEKQPPQVLMKDRRFSCQLRHLIGDGIYNPQFEAKVSLINTETATGILNGDHHTEINVCGKIINNSAKADRIEQSKQLVINMRNMCLSMRQRGDRGRADCVAEEKFCMIFRYPMSIRLPSNSECNLVAQTMSLPVVVISHGKQEADARATIFWDNAFSAPIRQRPFEVPDLVPWSKLLHELDCLWRKECHSTEASRGLDDGAKRYLTIKMWGEYDLKMNVNWRQFNRDNLHGKPFTFWSWFYKTMELVSSNYVREFWNKDMVKGFISKEDCNHLLSQCPIGTFMFRFSDSFLGALSISCHTNCNGHIEVGHLEPDTISSFKTRSLPDTVKDMDFLRFLFPNHNKGDIFGRYYSTHPQTKDYWGKGIRIVVGSNHTSGDHTNQGPVSPQAAMPHVHMSAMSSSSFVGSPAASSMSLPSMSNHSDPME